MPITAQVQKDKPECYHAICMWSADGCCKCKYDMDCYDHFLNFMLKNN